MEPQTKSPVMDVSAPPTQTVDHPEPVMAPPAAEPPKADLKTESKPHPADKKVPAKTKTTNAGPSSNVTLAIVATVVIVISLAAIATYAYMQQNT